MKSKLVLIAVACLVATAAADLPWDVPQRPRAQVYALEGLGALGGFAVCGLVVVPASSGIAIYIGLLLGAPDTVPGAVVFAVAVGSAGLLAPAAALGTIGVGRQLEEDGSVGWAFGGAYAGAVVGIGLATLGFHVATRSSDLAGVSLCVLGGLAIPTGAVVGYNLGVGRDASPSDFGSRLELPAVALTSTERLDHSVEYGVKAQLAGLRF